MGEFDGIREREAGKKKIPLGMAVLFLGLIVFGLAYLYLFSPQTTGWNQRAQYDKYVKESQALSAPGHEEDEGAESGALEKAEALERGMKVYEENCAMCHGEKLEGGIGPGLLGPKFIYGQSIEDHIKVISKGTAKGMPGYEKQLGASQIYNVSLYLHSQHKH